MSSTVNSQPANKVTSGFSKFVATSTANLSLCLYKDSRFTKMFGPAGQSPRPLPKATFALFAVRDCLTVFASFNVPPILAPKMQEKFGETMEQYISSASAAQFLAPAAVQLISTPVHLLGLDLYNREGAKFRERFSKIASEWGKSCLARMARIVPAFGFGGVVNTRMRGSLMRNLT